MDKIQLHEDITNYFNESELKDIFFLLNIPYEHISGANLPDKARELILYLDRRRRLPELVKLVVTKRPELQSHYDVAVAEVELPPRPSAPTSTSSTQTDPTPAEPAPVEDALAGNPFIAGPMVTKKEMFYGRQTEIRRLLPRLKNLGSCSIVGMRRVGKSSLMYYLCHFSDLANQPDLLIAHLDLQDGRYHTLTGLLQGIHAAWTQSLDNWTRPFEPTLSGFSQLVVQLRGAGHKPILCLDEFENLIKRPQEFTDDLFESWRSLGGSGQMGFLTVSQHPLADLINQSELTSNFYNIFNTVMVPLLAEEEAIALLQEPAQRHGHPFAAADVAFLRQLCGPHPFYLQMAAFQLFDMTMMGEVDKAQLRDDFSWAAERHWQGLWQALSSEEQAVYPLTWAEPATPVAEHLCTLLVRKGLLLKDGTGFKPFSQGFADWLKRSQPPNSQPPPEPPAVEPDAPQPQPTAPPPKPAATDTVDKGLLLLTVLVTLLVLVVTALVLRYILDVQNVGSLALLLAILLPFMLVVVGRLAGQDYIALLRDLFKGGK